MRSIVRSVRAFDTEWQRWKQCAEAAGLSVNDWARKALNRVAELDEAMARQAVVETPPEPEPSAFPFRGPDPRRK